MSDFDFTEKDRLLSQVKTSINAAQERNDLYLEETLPINLKLGEDLKYSSKNFFIKKIFKYIRFLRKKRKKIQQRIESTWVLRNGMNVDIRISRPYWCRIASNGTIVKVYKSDRTKKKVTELDIKIAKETKIMNSLRDFDEKHLGIGKIEETRNNLKRFMSKK